MAAHAIVATETRQYGLLGRFWSYNRDILLNPSFAALHIKTMTT